MQNNCGKIAKWRFEGGMQTCPIEQTREWADWRDADTMFVSDDGGSLNFTRFLARFLY